MRGVVFLGDRKLALADFPDPSPGPEEVIVGIRASGMCGSDLHTYRAPGDQAAPVIAGQQAVLFYLYADNLTALRKQLLASSVAASEITHPFYQEKGEIRVEDPNGYVLLIGQSD